jgi:hypothetical protein
MIISRKIVLTGVITLGVFALGSAGAAVAHTFTIEDRTGEVQNIAPVTTGANSPSPSESPYGDQSEDPTDSASPSPSESPSSDQSEDPTDSPSPSPSESPSSDHSEDSTGMTTVAPAPPVNLHESDSSVDNTGVEH